MQHVFKCAPIKLGNVCSCVCSVKYSVIADALKYGYCSRIVLLVGTPQLSSSRFLLVSDSFW